MCSLQVRILMSLFIISCSAERAPSLKLMLVGLSGRGKSTLLSHLKQIRKTQSLPITHRQRWQSSNTHGRCRICGNGKWLSWLAS